MRLYNLSFNNMDGKTYQPRVPKNFLTENGFEDNVTKRVCFTDSVYKSLIAMSMGLKDKELFVHIPKNKPSKIKRPTITQVPDSKITGEIWVMEDVELICIGKIKVIDWDGKTYRYNYGKGSEAEMYGWKYKWVERYSNIFELSLQLLNR